MELAKIILNVAIKAQKDNHDMYSLLSGYWLIKDNQTTIIEQEN